jgi:hypothetical protein
VGSIWVGALLNSFFAGQTKFELDGKVNVVELSSLLATIAAAFVLVHWSERRKHGDQLTKTAALSTLTQVREELRRCKDFAFSVSPKYEDIAAAVKALRRRQAAAKSALIRLGIDVTPEALDNVDKALALLNRLLTYTEPGEFRAGAALSISEGVVSISKSRLREVDTHMSQIEAYVFEVEAQVMSFA